MKPLTKISQTAKIENKNWKSEVYKFLFAYRSTPHSSTKVAPAELMFNRKIRYTIPNSSYEVAEDIQKKVEENDLLSKERNKQFIDNRKHAKDNTITQGDRVLVKQPKQNKLTPKFQPHPFIITHNKGTMMTAQSLHISKRSQMIHDFSISKSRMTRNQTKTHNLNPTWYQTNHKEKHIRKGTIEFQLPSGGNNYIKNLYIGHRH